MVNYIIRRLLLVPVLLFGVSLVIFAMIQLLSPVERSALYIRDVPKNPEAVQGVIQKYGLNDPFPAQYWRWLVGYTDPITGEVQGGVLRGDLGYSRSASQPVSQLIAERFPATIELAIWAILPIVVVAVWLGVEAAVHHNGWVDQLARFFAIGSASFPTFVIGLLLLMLFYAVLKWFPPGRLSDWASAAMRSPYFHNTTHLVVLDALLNGRFDIVGDALRHLVLPVVTLALISWATLLRVTRSSMLEALGQEYTVTARAKGASEGDVIRRHALPNAMIPVTTMIGFQIIALLGGVVITETVFNYPGIGSAAARAAQQLDVVTVLGLSLLTGLVIVVCNLLVDIAYAFVDPRVRLD